MPNLLALRHIKALFIMFLLLKLIVYLWLTNIQTGLLSLGGDANYYDQFAHGFLDEKWASSIWPIILRELDSFGLYNRHVISWAMFVIESCVVPMLVAESLPRPECTASRESYLKIYWHVATLVSLYPTIFFYSIDIYRDVIMALIFTVWVFVGLKVSGEKSIRNVCIIMALAALTYLLYLFRPYLGMSLLVALCISQINVAKIKLIYILIGYLILIAVMHSLGVLDALLRYRSLDVFVGGGTTLSINLNNQNSVTFLILTIWSGLLQLFGLYIVSFKAGILFLSESIFFSGCCWYVYKNKQFVTKFMRCILIFSVVYGTVWIIANDNLGTAVRLRIFNYLAVFFVAASIYLMKYLRAENLHREEAKFLVKEMP